MGGELFSVLREKTLFDEDTARFFAASVVLAFEYMHTMNVIYRDLKRQTSDQGRQGATHRCVRVCAHCLVRSLVFPSLASFLCSAQLRTCCWTTRAS